MPTAYLALFFGIALTGALPLLGDKPLLFRLRTGNNAAQHSIGMALQLTSHVPNLNGSTKMMLPILYRHRIMYGSP